MLVLGEVVGWFADREIFNFESEMAALDKGWILVPLLVPNLCNQGWKCLPVHVSSTCTLFPCSLKWTEEVGSTWWKHILSYESE